MTQRGLGQISNPHHIRFRDGSGLRALCSLAQDSRDTRWAAEKVARNVMVESNGKTESHLGPYSPNRSLTELGNLGICAGRVQDVIQ